MQFEIPDRIGQAAPDSSRLAKIREDLAKSAAPVRPLPSNLVMMLVMIAVFAAMATVLTVPVGFKGFAKLSAGGAVLEYSVIVLLALVLAGGVIEQMIPGSRRTLTPVAGVLVTILLLTVTASLQFPILSTGSFVHRGLPCLRLGTLCAIPAAGAVWVLMRRGFVLEARAAAVAGGTLAGLLGIGVLTLHCPIFESGHIIVWHVGVIVVTALVGSLLGWIAGKMEA